MAEGVDRVRQLLANAPADRAWRRWGYLVLCRARPDVLRRANATMVKEAAKETSDWCRRVLELQEEAYFGRSWGTSMIW